MAVEVARSSRIRGRIPQRARVQLEGRGLVDWWDGGGEEGRGRREVGRGRNEGWKEKAEEEGGGGRIGEDMRRGRIR